MVVNDDAGILNARVVFKSIASRLAPAAVSGPKVFSVRLLN